MEGQEVGRPKKNRAKYEVLVILIVIAAAVVAGVFLYKGKSDLNNEKLLQAQLAQLRLAVTTYKMLNKVNPPDLASLTKLTYSFEPGETAKRYISNMSLSKNGKLLDPFGNPYIYDATKGWVACTTPGYTDQ